MTGAVIVDTEKSLLLMRIKELEERHSTFRDSVVCAFNQLLDLKDISTGVHSTRLAEWALRVARKLDVPEECLYQVEVAHCCTMSARLVSQTPF
jgi:HD-GYP domain-containing protein (c-di-GMP phosphodiesterase class II)